MPRENSGADKENKAPKVETSEGSVDSSVSRPSESSARNSGATDKPSQNIDHVDGFDYVNYPYLVQLRLKEIVEAVNESIASEINGIEKLPDQLKPLKGLDKSEFLSVVYPDAFEALNKVIDSLDNPTFTINLEDSLPRLNGTLENISSSLLDPKNPEEGIKIAGPRSAEIVLNKVGSALDEALRKGKNTPEHMR